MDMFNFQRRPKGEKEIFSVPYVSTGTTVNYTVASDVVSLCLWGGIMTHAIPKTQHIETVDDRNLESFQHVSNGTCATLDFFLHDRYMRTYSVN